MQRDKIYIISLIFLIIVFPALLIFIYFSFKGSIEKFRIGEDSRDIGKKLYWAGWEYYKKQEYEKAIDKFKKVIRLFDEDDYLYASTYKMLISSFKKLKRHAEAEAILKEDIKANFKHSLYYIELINLYIATQRYKEAYEVAMIAKDIFKEDTCIQSLYAFTLNHNKEYKKAEKVLKNIFERGLGWRCEEVAYFELAYTYYKTNREKEGDLILVKYYQGDEDIVDEVKKRGEDFASKIVNRIPFPWKENAKRKPTDLELLELKAKVFLKHEPNETIRLLAEAYDFTNDIPSAKATYKKLLKIKPDDEQAREYLELRVKKKS